MSIFTNESILAWLKYFSDNAEIDLSNVQATAGEYDVPVNVEIRGAENVAVSGTYNARVRLTEQVENQPEP